MQEEVGISIFDELSQTRYFEYATTGQRFANYLIDLLVYMVFSAFVGLLLGIILPLSGASQTDMQDFLKNTWLHYLIGLIDWIIIYTLIEGATKGKSLGKLITRTKAVKEDLSPITWKDALLRSLCRLIPFEAFSAFGGNPWHDSLTKTHVIKNNILDRQL